MVWKLWLMDNEIGSHFCEFHLTDAWYSKIAWIHTALIHVNYNYSSHFICRHGMPAVADPARFHGLHETPLSHKNH